MKRWAKFWVDIFQKPIQMANKHLKICSMSLVIRKMQIEPQWDTTSNVLRWLYREAHDTKCWRGCGQAGPRTYCWESPASVENSLSVPQKVKQRVYQLTQHFYIVLKTCPQKNLSMSIAPLVIIGRMWKQARCPPTDEIQTNVAHSYNGVSFSHKRKWSNDSCYNMDETWKHYAK